MGIEKFISSKLMNIPALGIFIEISSDYVSEGSPKYSSKIPPLRFWIRGLGWPVFLSVFFALLTLPCYFEINCIKIEAKASSTAFSIIPSLLGFGIGAYALVFGLGEGVLRKIQDAHVNMAVKNKLELASVLHINSMFALPLLVMTVTILIATIESIFQGFFIITTVAWFFIFLSIALNFQLVKSLYRLGRVIILEKL